MRDVPRSRPARPRQGRGRLRELSARASRMPLDADERLLSAALGGDVPDRRGRAARSRRRAPARPARCSPGVLVLAFAALANVEFEIGTGAGHPDAARVRADALPAPARLGAAGGRRGLLDVAERRRRPRPPPPRAGARAPVLVLVRDRPGAGAARLRRRPAASGIGGRSTSRRSRPSSAQTSRAPLCASGGRVASWPRRLLSRRPSIAYGVDARPRAARAPGRVRSQPSMRYAFLLLLPVAIVAHRLRRRARPPHRARRSSCADAYAAPSSCSATSSRPTTPTPARHSQGVVELVLAVADVLRLTPERAHAGRVRGPAARRGQDPHPQDASSRSPGPLTAEERRPDRDAHGRGRADPRRRSAGRWPRSAPSSAPATSATTAPATPTAWPASEIPLVARIVCCCDAYSAMTTDRPYRAALTAAEAAVRAARVLRHAVRPARRRGR